MSLKSIKEIFAQEERFWTKKFEKITDFTRTVESTLQEKEDHDNYQTIRRQHASLEENYNELLKILHSPEVVLAIAGTTSAGKSTFANFLIGEKILPVDHNEMSAGIVKISHGEKRSLKIPEKQDVKTRGK
ncbi:MAG: dynamin family protein [Acetobacter sp.]|nr:dynamin family protein [Acetobacter sp.]